MKQTFICILIGCLLMAGFSDAQPLNMEKLHGLKARSIGPAGVSGRITAIDVVLRNPNIIYIGSASGGLWKSTGGGISWQPIFDEQPVASIGAIAIYQKNPDIIWVATGEGNPRNSQNFGNGVYRSNDGGKSWVHLGLENTRSIHRIFVHPDNPDICYVGVQGPAYGYTTERGVFKTTDGGKTWQHILKPENNTTGVGEMVMDPHNPDKFIVNMWDFHRDAWFFRSGGPGSGLHITTDGGKTWKKLSTEDGLPEGTLGRMGIAIARSRPNVVYALIESKKNALYRSDDGGYKWTKVTDRNIGNRPFYYAEIYVDPTNENRIYNLYSDVSVSEDGGKTFRPLLSNQIHSDHHAWWIHPNDPDFIIDGNDGGLAISRDRGKTWFFPENLPLSQFYHINVDMSIPYKVYGGMQDNGSWAGPSQVWRMGGIRNHEWEETSFGDGFDVLPDRSDNRYGYSMSQGGYLVRYDLVSGATKFIRPQHPDPKVQLRYNWNAAIAHDPFDDKTIYYGSQFVHKSTNRGDSWEIISPDLTTNDTSKQKQTESGGLTYDVTSAENHCTILAIAPSALKKGVIWVGTDDGNLQLTTDGGKTWTNLIKNIKGVPANTWIPQIQTSPFNEAEAVVVFDNHRRDDWTCYVFRTKDYGKTWERLAANLKGYALSFVYDLQEPNLMFLGTEFGLYVSIDGGKNWTKWTQGYPHNVSTHDMVIHPREHDLVIGTFGRSAYIIDDIRPLRALAKEGIAVLDKTLKVFPVPDAYMVHYRFPAGMHEFTPDNVYTGENRPRGAMISFVMNPKDAKTKTDTVKVEIVAANGEVVRTFRTGAKPGINRIYWNFSKKGVRMPNQPKPTNPNAPEPVGGTVIPGTYTVRISYADTKDSARVNVLHDPRYETTPEILAAREKMQNELMSQVSRATAVADNIRDGQEKIAQINRLLADRTDDKAKAVKKAGEDLRKKLTELNKKISGDNELQGIVRRPDAVTAILGEAGAYFRTTQGMPGSNEQAAINRAVEAVNNLVAQANQIFAEDWANYQKLVSQADITLIEALPQVK